MVTNCMNLLKLFALFLITTFTAFASAQLPSLTGDFPFHDVNAIFSGPFIHSDRSDLLAVQYDGGLIMGSQNKGGIAIGTSKLAIYSFENPMFRWVKAPIVLQSSVADSSFNSKTAWCFGNFHGDGRYTIFICDINRAEEIIFDEQLYQNNELPIIRNLKSPKIWIDQAIGCDIDGDGIDEIVTLEFPNDQDSCESHKFYAQYHLGVYKIDGDSLIQIWHGLCGVGAYRQDPGPDRFISKCKINGITEEVPIIKGPQSDVSPSAYDAIGKAASGEYGIVCRFPRPPQVNIRKGEKCTKKQMDLIHNTKWPFPVGGTIFDDNNKVLYYGYLINPAPQDLQGHGSGPDDFAELDGDHWNRLEKTDSLARGMMCNFTIEPGKSGWLFIHDGKFYFYDKLPVK